MSRKYILLIMSTIFCMLSCDICSHSSDTDVIHFDVILYDDLL